MTNIVTITMLLVLLKPARASLPLMHPVNTRTIRVASAVMPIGNLVPCKTEHGKHEYDDTDGQCAHNCLQFFPFRAETPAGARRGACCRKTYFMALFYRIFVPLSFRFFRLVQKINKVFIMRSLQSRSQKKAIKSPTEIYAWAEKTRIMPSK